MGGAHPDVVAGSRILRSVVRLYRHCLQLLRATSTNLRRRPGPVQAHATHGETSITDRPCQLHIRDAGRFRRAAARLRFDLHSPDPPFATGYLYSLMIKLHRSMTTS